MHFNNVVDTKTSACFDVINILCYHVTLTLHFTIMPFVENLNKHVVHQNLNFRVKYLAIRYMSFNISRNMIKDGNSLLMENQQ